MTRFNLCCSNKQHLAWTSRSWPHKYGHCCHRTGSIIYYIRQIIQLNSKYSNCKAASSTGTVSLEPQRKPICSQLVQHSQSTYVLCSVSRKHSTKGALQKDNRILSNARGVARTQARQQLESRRKAMQMCNLWTKIALTYSMGGCRSRPVAGWLLWGSSAKWMRWRRFCVCFTRFYRFVGCRCRPPSQSPVVRMQIADVRRNHPVLADRSQCRYQTAPDMWAGLYFCQPIRIDFQFFL